MLHSNARDTLGRPTNFVIYFSAGESQAVNEKTKSTCEDR